MQIGAGCIGDAGDDLSGLARSGEFGMELHSESNMA
jgi:hypothetical protein